MTRTASTSVRVIIHTADFEETGSGIILRTHPLTLLVPSHVSIAIEQGNAEAIVVNSHEYKEFKLLAAPMLEREHLSIIECNARAPQGLKPVALPRMIKQLTPGTDLVCHRQSQSEEWTQCKGTLTEVITKGIDATLVTDIKIAPGDSGSPILLDDKLVGICVGMTPGSESGYALAVPLSPDSLRALRRIIYRRRRIIFLTAISILCIAFALVAVRSWTTFTIAGVDGPENSGSTNNEAPNTITASNDQLLTFRPTWKRTFPTSIRWWVPLSIDAAEDRIDRVAIGTLAEEDLPGSLFLLGNLGRTLWSYTVPDGECVFNTQTESYNRYKVYRVFIGDLTGDGRNEVLASFTHEYWYPTKIMLFDLSGQILGEYWHPGYVRTFAIGNVGESEMPMLIMTGSNNRFRPLDSPWNPQGLMAFSSSALEGQAPPYTGTGEPGNETWYYLLPNVDDEHKSHFDNIIITDSDGDGKTEILAHTSDDRFYYLNAQGDVLRVELGDEYLKEFGNIAAPELQRVELDPARYEGWDL